MRGVVTIDALLSLLNCFRGACSKASDLASPRANVDWEKESAVLVLSRRPNEAIVLPGLNVTIRVASVQGNAVRIGIEAPPDVGIFRAELLSRVPANSPTGAASVCLVAAG